MKIDLHTHILPPEIPRFKNQFGYGGFIQIEKGSPCSRLMKDDGTFFREVLPNVWDITERERDCQKHGVTHQVLSTVPVCFSYWAKPQDGLVVSQFLNDHLAECISKMPLRFSGLGTLPMQDPELAIGELERCIVDLKLKGVQIGSHVNGLNWDDPRFFPFFKRASELSACLFIHPWEMLGEKRTEKYWMPWLVGMPMETCIAMTSLVLGGVLERLPSLRIGFAHGGGAFPYLVGRLERGFATRPDLVATHSRQSPRDSLGKFYVDSLVHDERALKYLIETVGEDRVVLGSDYPFPLGEEIPGSILDQCGLSAAVKEKILFKNAVRFLGFSGQHLGPFSGFGHGI